MKSFKLRSLRTVGRKIKQRIPKQKNEKAKNRDTKAHSHKTTEEFQPRRRPEIGRFNKHMAYGKTNPKINRLKTKQTIQVNSEKTHVTKDKKTHHVI